MSFPALVADVLFNQDQHLKITFSPPLPLASSSTSSCGRCATSLYSSRHHLFTRPFVRRVVSPPSSLRVADILLFNYKR